MKRPEASGNSTAGTSASSIGWKVPHRGEGKVLVGCQDVGGKPCTACERVWAMGELRAGGENRVVLAMACSSASAEGLAESESSLLGK